MTDKRLKMPSYLCQFTLKWSILDGDIAENVLYMRREDCVGGLGHNTLTWDDSAALDQAAHLGGAFQTNLASFMAADVSLTSIDYCWNEVVDTGPLHVGTQGSSGVGWGGTNTGDPANNGITLACRLQTGLGGRGNHGRFYFVGVNTGLYNLDDPNRLKDSSITDFGGALSSLLADINNNDCVAEVGSQYWLAVASFITGGGLRTPTVSHKVTAINLSDPYFDFQRRRAPGHARHG